MGVFTSNIFSNETKESVLSELDRLRRELEETQTRLQLYKNVSAELNSEMAVEAIMAPAKNWSRAASTSTAPTATSLLFP